MSGDVLLPSDVWAYIGLKLHTVGDRIRFRAVCKSWRSGLPFRQPPSLMLSQDEELDVQEEEEESNQEEEEESIEEEEEESNEEDVQEESNVKEEEESEPSEEFIPPPPSPRGFVSLTDQQIYQMDIPELDRVRTVGSTDNNVDSQRMGSISKLQSS